MGIIELNNITHTYKIGQVDLNVLKGIDLSINRGDFVSIMGPSGSGKSTLMNIIGCLDIPTSGTYKLNDLKVDKMNDAKLSEVRNEHIGFIFQNFHLMSHMRAIENVQLPLIYRGMLSKERKKLAEEALEMVGLKERMHHFPSQLSGGEKQRVAIARALVMKPLIILADEPTGALDSKTSGEIMDIFVKLNKELDMTIVQVTHDPNISEYGNTRINILDGVIHEHIRR